jgi:hypothetical protein
MDWDLSLLPTDRSLLCGGLLVLLGLLLLSLLGCAAFGHDLLL